MNARADEAVFVGDDLRRDVEPAKKLGMTTVWITDRPRKHPAVDVAILGIGELEMRSAERTR